MRNGFIPTFVSFDTLAEDAIVVDPTDALIDGLDAASGDIAIDPLRLLATMCSEGSIDANERDAGEILHRMFKAGTSHLGGSGKYDWRDKDGKWTRCEQPRKDILAKLDETIEAVRSIHRSRAVRHALAAAQPVADIDNLSALAAGLEDVVRIWWGAGKRNAVVTMSGISLAAVAFGDDRVLHAENDNEAPDATRVLEGFERMWKRGQLDKIPRINESLYAAGLRYRTDHHSAGLAPLGAIDYGREKVDCGSGAGTSVGGLYGSDRAVFALERYRQARAAMGTRFAPVVDAVLIDGKTLEEAGEVIGQRGRGARIAVAGDRLSSGLRNLAVFYGTLTRREAAA